MSNTKPIALVTNDDGVQSEFFLALAAALCKSFEVVVAVPQREQSWAGRSFTRRGSVAVHPHDDPRWRGWVIDGTPSDCVNIACGRLLDEMPAIVVSGINMGFNVTLPLVLTSGTVAAALEGALWGCPALAVSMALPRHEYESAKSGHGRLEGQVAHAIHMAAQTATGLAESIAAEAYSKVLVHNVNFPFDITADTPIERTSVGGLELGCIFAEHEPGQYQFRFPETRRPTQAEPQSDMACLKRGHISHSIIDYQALGQMNDMPRV